MTPAEELRQAAASLLRIDSNTPRWIGTLPRSVAVPLAAWLEASSEDWEGIDASGQDSDRHALTLARQINKETK